MIKKLSSIRDLAETLANEEKTTATARYSCRFILLSSYEQLTELESYLEDFFILNYQDLGTIPTKDDLINIIHKSEHDRILIPYLTEFLRMSDKEEIGPLLITFLELERSACPKTVLLPIIGLDQALIQSLERIFIDSQRNPELLQAPFYNIERIQLTNISALDWVEIKNLPAVLEIKKELSYILDIQKSKVKKYFIFLQDEFWMHKFDSFIQDNIFLKKEITTIQELIKEVYQIDITFPYDDRHQNYWNKLICLLTEKKICNVSQKDLVEKLLNVYNIDNLNDEAVIKIINSACIEKNSSFIVWLLLSYLTSEPPMISSYLNEILIYTLKKSDFSYQSIITSIWCRVFHIDNGREMLDDRRNLLTYIHRTLSVPYDKIEHILGQYINEATEFEYLTDLTEIEKKLIIKKLAKTSSTEVFDDLLQSVYFKDLSNYIEIKSLNVFNDSTEIDWISDYIEHYCKAKIFNKKTEKINTILKEKNRDLEFFAKWNENVKSVRQLQNAYTNLPIVWIDAMGLEWLALFVNEILESGQFEVEQIHIAKVRLPSTTNNNNIEESILKLSQLDECIHSQNPYSFPDSLVKEFNIVRDIIAELENRVIENRFIVTSDHGFSFLSQKAYGIEKKYSFEKAEHDGRYCISPDPKIKSCEDYIVYNANSTQYLIASKHYSLNNTPYREVHGGCTPEECLVPFIILNKKHNVDFEINVPGPFSSKNEIEIRITPNPITVDIMIGGLKEKMQYDTEKRIWKHVSFNLALGTYDAELIINKTIKKNITIQIVGGLTATKMEDLFND